MIQVILQTIFKVSNLRMPTCLPRQFIPKDLKVENLLAQNTAQSSAARR